MAKKNKADWLGTLGTFLLGAGLGGIGYLIGGFGGWLLAMMIAVAIITIKWEIIYRIG